MKSLADGDLETEVEGAGRNDEIGDMAQAVEVFKQNALRVAELNKTTQEHLEQAADYEGQIAAIGKAQAVIEFELDGTIVTANENFLNALGYRLDEIKGRKHSIFVAPGYAETAEYKEFWAKLRRGEYQAAEYLRIGKGGREVWIQASYNPILDLNGKPYKVVKFATDVTGRKHAMQRLSASLELLAEGRLNARIEDPFISEFEGVRSALNQTVDRLDRHRHAAQADFARRQDCHRRNSCGRQRPFRTHHQAGGDHRGNLGGHGATGPDRHGQCQAG